MTRIITLTTDFGTKDGYVGAMKGRILSMSPASIIVDISHDIAPQNIAGAAWCLARSTSHFPKGSIHVAVVDPGVGSNRSAIVLRIQDQWFVGPDNGIFSRIIRGYDDYEIYRLFDVTTWWETHQSFDGLALFAPAAACLANGIDLSQMGERHQRIKLLADLEPTRSASRISGKVLMFDRFGNAITNITRSDINAIGDKDFTISVGSQHFRLGTHYQEGGDQTAMAIVNSDNLLELTVYCNSARELYQLNAGDQVVVEFS